MRTMKVRKENMHYKKTSVHMRRAQSRIMQHVLHFIHIQFTCTVALLQSCFLLYPKLDRVDSPVAAVDTLSPWQSLGERSRSAWLGCLKVCRLAVDVDDMRLTGTNWSSFRLLSFKLCSSSGLCSERHRCCELLPRCFN